MTSMTPRAMPPEGYTLLREAAELQVRAAEIERAAYRLAMWRDLARAAESRADKARQALIMFTALSKRPQAGDPRPRSARRC